MHTLSYPGVALTRPALENTLGTSIFSLSRPPLLSRARPTAGAAVERDHPARLGERRCLVGQGLCAPHQQRRPDVGRSEERAIGALCCRRQADEIQGSTPAGARGGLWVVCPTPDAGRRQPLCTHHCLISTPFSLLSYWSISEKLPCSSSSAAPALISTLPSPTPDRPRLPHAPQRGRSRSSGGILAPVIPGGRG